MFRSINSKIITRFRTSCRCLSVSTRWQNKSEKTIANHSFVHNIFRGQLETSQLFPYPMPLSVEEVENVNAIVGPLTKFLTHDNDADKNDELGKIDEAKLRKLGKAGLLGVQVPEAFGGLGLNNTQMGRICEIVGLFDLGLAGFLAGHQSVGLRGILLLGTKEQKAKYLPRLVSGEAIAAFALTEPEAGSDIASIKTRAVKSPDGKHYILNGSKVWITNGSIADIITVFAMTEVRDDNGKTRDKMTAFIVERGFEGVTSTPPYNNMGLKCTDTAGITFENVKVPAANVIAGEGNGLNVAMTVLGRGRFTIAMTLSGAIRVAIQKAAEHASQRKQFGKTLENFQGIQEKLARMATLYYVNQSIAYMVTANIDTGSNDYQLEASVSKVFATESAWYVCDEAIQILGGMGFMRSAGLERYLRDMRAFRILEGTSEILRLLIALSGIRYAGSRLQEVQKALKNPAAHLGVILGEASRRTRTFLKLDGVDMTQHVDSSLSASAKLCSESVDMLARSVDKLLLKHGKRIVEEQFLLNRIADAVIDIYGMACTLSRATRSLKLALPSAEQEQLMTENWCVEASNRVKNNLRMVEDSDFSPYYKRMSLISRKVCEVKDVTHKNPIGI